MSSSIPQRRRFISRASLMVAAAMLGLAVSTAPKAKAATFNWGQTALNTYSWNDGANWGGGSAFPNAIDDVANLNTALVGAETVNLNVPITIGSLNIGATTAFGYTLATGFLTLDGTSSTSITKTGAGSDTISAGIQFNDALTITNSSTAGVLTILGAMSSLTSNITITGTGAVSAGSTITGAISTAGNFIKDGSGIVQMNGAGTYAGTTSVSAGRLIANTGTSLPIRSAITISSGAFLEPRATLTFGSLAGAGDLDNPTANARTPTIGRDDTSTIFSGRITASTTANLAITKIGAGTLTLQPTGSNANNYTGITTVSGGKLVLDTSNSILTSAFWAATPLTLSGGNFELKGRSAATLTQTLGAFVLGATGGSITLTPNSGTSTNLVLGAVTATASGGALLITSPTTTTVKLGNAILTTALNGRAVFSDGTANTFNWATNATTATAVSGFLSSTTLPSAGGGLVGTSYILSAGQTQGTANATIGTLKLGSTSGTTQVLDLATFNMQLGGGTTSTPGAILIDGTANWNINGSSGLLTNNTPGTSPDLIFQHYGTGTVTVNAGIGGATALALVKAGTGTLVLAGTNAFTGAVFVDGGVLSFSNVLAAGAGSLGNGVATAVTIRNGATLKYTGATGGIAATLAGSHTFLLAGGNATIDVATAASTDALTLSGVISGAGGLTKAGIGILKIGVAATYTGPTFVTAGTLQAGITSAAFGATSPLDISAGATVDINSLDQTIGSLSGAGTVTNSTSTSKTLTTGGANLTTVFSGTFTNGTATTGSVLTKVGSGILTLSGSTSAWTGGGNVNGGVLRLGASGVLNSTGGWVIANAAGPAQLELGAGFTQTLSSTTVLTFGGSSGAASSQGNVLIGSTAVLTIGGNVTYTMTGNPLGAVISGSGSLAVSNTRTFTIGNSTATDAEVTISVPITSTGGVALAATTAFTNAGNLYSTANNTYTGTTQINNGGGTLTFTGNNTSMTGGNTLYGGTLALVYTTDNNRKISSGILTLSGGSIVATGNASATTADTVTSTTLAGGGRSSITLNSGSGQALNFTLGTITRAAGAGTLRVTLPTSGSLSIGATANPTAGYLPYAAVNTASGYMFGTVSSGTLIAYSSTATDAIGSWTANQNVTDTQSSATSVYSGSLAAPGLTINSLRFNAAGTSTVTLDNNAVLNIAGGGVMTTSAVGANAASITGGYLTSTAAELVFLQDNTSQAFTVSSRIIGSTAVTMGGTGGLTNANLTLNSASNYFTGTTTISGGTLQVSGGNAIGDTSAVTIANSGSNPTLSLGASVTETIGSLSGGGTTGGTISLGSAAVLTINQTSGLTFSGFLNSNTNSNAKIIKSGSGTLTVDQAVGASFNGIFEISQGQVTFSGNVNQLAAVTSLILSGPTAVLSLPNDQTTAVSSRIFDTATVTLSNTAGALGLYMSRTAGTTTGTETVGPLTLNAGQNTITADGTATSRIAAIKFTNATPLVRNNYSTALLLARNFDTTSTQGGRVVFSVTPGGAIGGAGAAASTTISIFPYFIGENTAGAPVAATNVGNSFVMFVDGTLGVRPLNLTTEYVLDSAAPATGTNNVRYTATNAITTPAAINSLVLDSAAGVALTGSASSMEITSGAILAAGAGSSSISTLTGLTSGATPVPYHVYVTNASGVLTLNTPLTSAAPLVKSGAGTLVLSSASNAFTDLYLNLGTVQADALNKLGTGAMNFFGGTLKFGAAFDATAGPKTVLIGTGGATFDTNGFSPTFANALGNSGAGGLTKIGTGTLTLNGAASYSGATTVSAGTLAMGVNSAIGTGALTVSSAATLAMGAFNATVSGLTLSAGSANVISGSGTLTVNGDATLNQGSIAPVLAGSVNLLKSTASQTVTLSNAASTFTGVTWIQDGTLSVTALADAGSNSSLGAATGANSGILIGNAASTNATLAYSSASSSSSNRAILLAGTTGGATIDSGALAGLLTLSGQAYGIVAGAKTLTLQGSNGTTASLNVYSGAISDGVGTVALTKAGLGGWTISGSNAFTGATAISGGALNVQNATGLGTTAAGTTVSSGGTLELQGGITIGAEALSLSGSGLANLGALRNISGTNTYGGLVTLAAASRINSDAGVLNLDVSTGSAVTGTFALTLGGSGNGNISDPLAMGTAALIKDGTGTWTLMPSAVNTYTGATTVNNGVLAVDFSQAGVATNIISASSVLTLAGGKLSVKGMGAATDSQTFASTSTTAGTYGVLSADKNSATSLTVALGTWTRNANSGLNFDITGAPTVTVTLSAGLSSASGIITSATTGAAVATYNQNDWATLSGSSPVAYAGYVNNTFTSGTNTNVVSFSGNGTAFTANTLRLVGAGGGTLTLAGVNTLNAGAILIGSTSGAVTLGGTGSLVGTAHAAAASGELNIFQNSSSAATISASILNNPLGISYVAATPYGETLNKFGAGTLVLSSLTNAWTGGTNIGAGTLKLGAANVIPDGVGNPGALTIASGGTFDLSGFSETINGLAGSGIVDNTSGSAVTLAVGSGTLAGSVTSTFSGMIKNSGGGAISLVKVGAGTLTLSNPNTYTGSTTINQGGITLTLSLATGPNTDILPANTALTLGSGSLIITGRTAATGNSTAVTFGGLTLAGGGTLTVNGSTSGLTSVSLGTITRNAGSGLAVNLLNAFTTATTITANTGTSILGGWAVQGATVPTTWAVSAGNGTTAGAITGLSTFLTTASGANTAANYLTTSDVDVTTSPTLGGGVTINSLRFNTAGALTLTLTGSNIINTGGILVTATAGSNVQTITGGTLLPGSGAELIINNFNTNTVKTLQIGSIIANNGATATNLTINGGGLVQLRGVNTFTGAVVINGGTYEVGTGASTATSAGSPTGYTLNGGTFNWKIDADLPAASILSLGPAGGTFYTESLGGTRTYFQSTAVLLPGAGSRILTLSGGSGSRIETFSPILGDPTGGVTGLTVSMGGDTTILRLNAAQTYTGLTLITRGILDVNQVANTIAGGFTSSATTGNIIFAATGTNRAVLSLGATSGDFTRSLGYGPGQVHWEGHGGFSNSTGGTTAVIPATRAVNLGGSGTQLTWGAGGFVPTLYSLQFGHGAAAVSYNVGVTGAIDFQNAIQLGASSRTVDVVTNELAGSIYQAELSGVLSTLAGGGLTKDGVGILLVTNAGNAAASSGATVTLTKGALIFGSSGAILGSGANITLPTAATTYAAIGMIGDTNPTSTLGSRIANPSTSTAAFLLGADSAATLDFTNFPNMRLAAFQYTAGTTPSGLSILTTFTGTINPANSTYRLGGRYATSALASGLSTSTLVLGSKNILTSSNAANFTFGPTTLTDSNNYTGGTVINGNTFAAVRIGVGSNTAFGTGTIAIQGNQTTHLGNINGDHTLSNNITFDSASTGGLEFAADPGTGGMLNNTNQGTMSYLGTVDFGGRNNPTLTGRPRGGLFLGDLKNATSLNYTQGSGGYMSLLASSTNGGVAKSFTGTLSIGNDAILVIDSANSFGAATTLAQIGTTAASYSVLQLHGAATVSLASSVNVTIYPASRLYVNTPSGATLTIDGAITGATTGYFVKTGLGTLVLSGDDTAAITTGTLFVYAGTLRLDAAALGATVWTAGQALQLGVSSGTFGNGGTLEITGTSAQTFGAVSVAAKANTIKLTGAMALTLGAVTRSAVGGTINFDVGSSGVTSITSTTTALSGLVSGGAIWTDSSGVDWAAASGSAITKYTAYTALTGSVGAQTLTSSIAANYLISSATSGNVTMAATGTISINTLKYSDTTARTIDVRNSTTPGILRLGAGSTTTGVTEAGGILVAPNSGALTIGVSGTPGTITVGSSTSNSTGDLIFINQSTNAVTVNSVIANNGTGAPALVNSGTGKVILAGANTWTGSLYLNRGILEVGSVNNASAAGPLGQATAGVSNILLNGGTFRANLSANGATDHGFTINAPSTIEVVANTLTLNTTLNGLPSANQQTGILNAGILRKAGAGTLELKDLSINATNANLSIEVVAGTLLLNKVTTTAISAIDLAGGAGLIIDGVASGAAPTVKLSGTGGNQISDASSVVVNSGTVSGVFDLNGLSETIDGLAGGGSVTNTLGSTTSTLSLGGNNSAGLSAYTLAASAAGVNASGLNSFSGVLSDGSGTLKLTKLGSGTQILSGANTYTGLTTISAGTLQMGADNVLPSGSGKLAVTIEGTNTGTNVGANTSNGSDRVLAPGTLDMGGFNLALNGLNSTTGGFVTSNPTLAYNGTTWAVAAARQSAKNLTLGSGDASASFNGVIRDGYTVAPGLTTTAYVGVINLIKVGTGTQTLSGVNIYGGSTSVQNGTLVLAGGTNRLASTTAVTLGSGSTSGMLQLGSGGVVSQTIAGLATSGTGTVNKVVGGHSSNATLIVNQSGTSTFAGALGGAGTNQNKLNFTLQGGGTLTLNGDNTLAGTTTVQGASTLILDSDLANSAVTVGGASAGTLVSNQTITGLLTVSSGGVVAPGNVLATEIGTLTLGGGLTLNSGGTLAMQIGSSATLTTPLVKDLITISGGALTLNAGGLISLSELTPAASVGALLSFAPGNYQLINYAAASNFATIAAYNNATLNGLLSLTSSVIGSNNYYVTLVNNAAGFIELNVDNARFWSGATNGKWNTAVANWSPVNPTLYLNTDKVLFQDTYPLIAGNGNVVNSNIDVTTSVTPAAMTFNNSAVNYTLSGAGDIGGSTGLTKSGTGTLTITNANTFTGNTVISGGYVEMQHAAALGTTAGSISVASGAALRLSAGISVGAKAISLTGDGISSTGAMRSISGNNSFAGAITLAGNTRINSDADTLTLSGALNNGSNSLTFGGAGNVTVSGIIGSGSGALVVDGTGVVTLSNAANTYTGQTFITNGTLSVSNIGSVSVAGGLGTPTTTGDGTIAIGGVANTGTLKWTGSSNESTDRVIDLAGTTGGATIDASGSGVLTLSSAITATGVGAKSLTLTGTGGTAGTPNVISSGISDGASAVISLIKTGAGVWKLNAASAYTGTTTIQNGTLLLGSFSQDFSALTLGGLSGGAATLALGSSGTATLTGDVTFSAANNPSGATISGSGTATLDLNAATRTFVVVSSSSANGADLTISAVIADALTGGALTKTGNGTLVLTGANTYAGATTVDGGTLSVSPQAISSSLTINVGTNSTAGALNFYADGAVADVNLASEANLNIGSASAAGGLGFKLSGSSADKITLAGAGALTVGATGGLINARALASLTPGSFTLIDATNNSNTATITGFTLGVLTGGYSYALDDTTGGQLKLTVAAAAAGPYYWTGARSTTSWAALASNGTTSNWATVSAAGTDAGATPGNIDVIFTLGTAVTTTLDQPYAISGLTFAGSSAGNGNVTINAGSGDGVLTLGANGVTVSTGASSSATTIGANVVLSSAQSWSVADSGQTLTVSGIISGNGNLLTKSGSGALVLTGANTFNGGLTANAGTVKVNNANSLGAVAGTLTLNNATLQATAGFTDSRIVTLGHANSAISVDTAQTLTYANTVSTKLTGSGVLNASGAGKLVLDDRLNGNDFVGGAILSGGGTVQVYGLGSLGSGNITLNAATLQVSGTFTDARLLTVGNAASAISVDSGQTLTVSGKITGTGNLNASGAGVLVLNDSGSANDFIGNSILSGGGTVRVASLTALGTGSITINAATLQATTSLSYSGKNFILGNAASALTVASGDTFTITNSGSTLVSGSGKLNANVAGILVLDDTLNPNTFSGGSVLSGGGTVKIKTLTSLGDETVAAALKDITLQATETITTTRNFTLGSYASTIAVDSTKTLALSGNIVDGAQAGALTKTGNGVLELSGTGNTFTGGTTVTAGTLKVSNASGSATGTGAVTVSGSSTTLSGAGTITGTATIASGSILSPGGTGTAGTLTLGGLTLASGSSLSYQLGANTAASDKTVVTGSSLFTANGGAITLTGLSGLTSTTYNLITYSGAIGGTGFGGLSLASGSEYVTQGGSTYFAYLADAVGSVNLSTTKNMTWNGNVSGTVWNMGSSGAANWKADANTGVKFFDGMTATFDDTATGFTVNLPGTVSPSSVTFSAVNNYVVQGAGKITGSTGLAKSGGGTLTIETANDFIGNVTLTGGAIEMKDPSALGSGSISIAGSSLRLNDDGSGSINLATRITSYSGGSAIYNVAGNNSATLPSATLTSATSFVSDAGSLTLAGNITSNAFAVSLLGNGGDITLTGATFSGGNSAFNVTMIGGTATIANNLTTGTSSVVVGGTGTAIFNGNVTSTSTGNGVAVSGSGVNTFNGTVNVSGTAGSISINTTGGTTTFANNVTINSTGSLTIAGSGTTVFNGSGKTVTTNGGAISISGAAVTTFDSAVNSGSGTWTVSGSGNTTLNGAINSGAGTWAVSGTGNTTVNGAITGSGTLTKTGSGALTLAATNSNYSGAITFNTSSTNIGTILATANNALGTGAVAATYQTGATGLQVQLSGGISLGNAFTTTGAGAAGGVSGIIRSIAGANVLTGNVTLTGGGGSSTYRADSGTSVAFNGNIGADGNTGRYIILVGAGDFSFGSAGSIVQTLTTGGTTGLWSTNTGTTTINSTANTYALVTAIGAGNTVVVANLSNGGVAGSLGAATTASGNLLLDGGTLKYSGSGAQSTDRLFSVGSALNSGGGATLDASGATSADTMSFVAAGPIGFTGMTGAGTSATEAGARTLTLTGTNTGANTLTSTIGDQAASTGVTSVTKSGAGTWVLLGANDYTGLTTISNGTLQIGSGTTGTLGSGAVSNAGTLAINRSNAYGVSNAISGVGGLTQSGNGTLTLSGANTYTGVTTISGGTLSVSTIGDGGVASGNLGSATNAAANLVINGGTLKYTGALASSDRAFTVGTSGATIDAAGSGTLTLSGSATLSGTNTARTFTLTSSNGANGIFSGSLGNNGTGATALTKSGSGTWTLSGANSYTGVTTLNGGTISVDSLGTGSGTSALGASTLTDVTKLVITGATINYTGTGGTYDRYLTVGDGTFGLANNGSGALVLSSAAKIDFADTVGADRILNLSGANINDNTFAAASFDAGDEGTSRVFSQIVKDGVGTWILSGPKNRFRGDVRINGGTLGFETGTLPDNQRISMADGAVLRWEAGNTNDISGKLNPDANSNVVLKVNGGSVTFAMDMIFVGTGATANAATARVTKSGVSDLEITHSQSFTGGFTINAGRLIATAAGSLGAGTTIVNNGGTLAANGNNSSTNVDVNNGGILTGTGTLHAVNILTGGTLAPGASPGILIADSLVLGANSNFQWQVHDAASVAGTGWDKIMVTNNLDLSGVSSAGTRISINVMSLSNSLDTVAGNADHWSKDDIHTLLFGHVGGVTWNSGRGTNIADYFSFDTSAFTTSDSTGIHNSLWSMSYDGGTGDITLTAVPEPSTYGFAIGALALAAAAIRRRKQKEKKV